MSDFVRLAHAQLDLIRKIQRLILIICIAAILVLLSHYIPNSHVNAELNQLAEFATSIKNNKIPDQIVKKQFREFSSVTIKGNGILREGIHSCMILNQSQIDKNYQYPIQDIEQATFREVYEALVNLQAHIRIVKSITIDPTDTARINAWIDSLKYKLPEKNFQCKATIDPTSTTKITLKFFWYTGPEVEVLYELHGQDLGYGSITIPATYIYEDDEIKIDQTFLKNKLTEAISYANSNPSLSLKDLLNQSLSNENTFTQESSLLGSKIALPSSGLEWGIPTLILIIQIYLYGEVKYLSRYFLRRPKSGPPILILSPWNGARTTDADLFFMIVELLVLPMVALILNFIVFQSLMILIFTVFIGAIVFRTGYRIMYEGGKIAKFIFQERGFQLIEFINGLADRLKLR
jgi:hypothetical protein